MSKLTKEEKIEVVSRLWQKYCYIDGLGYRSDRKRIIEEFEKETGEPITASTISNYTGELDLEYLYNTRGDRGVGQTYSENANGNITSTIRQRMKEKRTFTNRELLELHAINPDENEIDRIVSNEWSMTNADGETYFNFQSKIIAVPIVEKGLSMSEFLEAMRDNPIKHKIKPVGIGTRNLGIGLADLHFGRTPREYIKPHLDEICDILENGYKTIMIAQLGDLFESSQFQQTITEAGTILPSVDMVEAWADAKWFYHTLIEHALKYSKNIIIEHACGNHSGSLEYAFLDGVKDRYELLGNVDVRHHNNNRAASKIDSVGIILSHGHGVKLKDLPLKFASEYPLVWAECEHREAWSGHLHNQFTTSDIDGNVMRQFPSPKPPTKYEDKYGYNSRELIQAVEWSSDRSKVIYEINP